MKAGTGKSHALKRSYLRHAVPVTVWLACVGVVIGLFYQRSARFELVGFARGEVRQIATSSTARIKDIHVKIFDPVKAGQLLVTVDTVLDDEQMVEAELKTQLAVAGAEVERLAALLIPTQEQLQSENASLQISREDNWRRFTVDAEAAKLRVLELQALIASDQVTCNGLAVEMKTCEKLLADDAIVPYELEKIKVEHDSLLRKIEENQRFQKQAELDLQQAEQRRDEFARQEVPKQSADAALEAIRKEIKVQEETIKGLLEQLAAFGSRRSVSLTSPIDGRVIPIHARTNDALNQRPGEDVLRRRGEVVAAGDAILAVSEEKPSEIVAYVDEQLLGSLKEQMPVDVVKTRTPAQVARSKVAYIGPTIELMPQRLWRNPAILQWGRPVLIEVPPGLDIVPGELVGIRGL
ncbi:MAG: hypothetical protein A2Y77_04670 [Planctomycetes bacterium RBG_13_62_9]|nr:MAG: hypothetical protein A2Y77_04670 [Planctomycetes bacterium RBG_13_62_9]